MRKGFVLLLAALTGLASCTSDKGLITPAVTNDDPVEVVLHIDVPTMELEVPRQENANMFTKAGGFKFYISNISYKDKNGNFVLVRDAFLYDHEPKNDTIQLMIPPSATAIKFGIGVPPGINTGDPTLYGSKHPYSIKGSKGMHWGWNTGYRFVLYEGKRDTVEGGLYEEPFSFHTGTDSLYREMEFALPTEYSGVSMVLDPSKFFQNIDLNTEYATHTVGNPDLARRFTDNFISAISLVFMVH